MNTTLNKIALCLSVILASLLSGAGDVQAAACASPAMAVKCVLDQQMWLIGGSDQFGGNTWLGQSFVTSAAGRICKVTLRIRKNNAAGALTLRIRAGGPGGAVLATMTRAVNALGGPQVIDFNFACATPILAPKPNRYFLELSANNSPANSYTWINSQGVGGDAAFPFGQGFHSVAGWRPYDYAFRVYMCR